MRVGACAQTAKTKRPPSAASAQGRSRPARLLRQAQRRFWRRRNATHRTLAFGEDVDQFTEEGEDEGETIIHKRERFSHELTLAYADGTVVELKTTKEGGQEN